MSCSAEAAVVASKSIVERGVELKAREGYKSWGSGTSRPRRALLLLTRKVKRENTLVSFLSVSSRVWHAGRRPPAFSCVTPVWDGRPVSCSCRRDACSTLCIVAQFPAYIFTNTALSVISPNPHKPVFFSPPKLHSQNPQNRGIATYNI